MPSMTPADRPAAILFDAGGTLILQDPEEMGRRLGAVIDPTDAHRAHYQAMAEYSDLRLAGRESTGIGGWSATSRSSKWPIRIWPVRESIAASVLEPSPRGSRDDRRQLKESGMRVAVVSNSDGSVRGSLGKRVCSTSSNS